MTFLIRVLRRLATLASDLKKEYESQKRDYLLLPSGQVLRIQFPKLDGCKQSFDACSSVGVRCRVDDLDFEPFKELSSLIASVVACTVQQEHGVLPPATSLVIELGTEVRQEEEHDTAVGVGLVEAVPDPPVGVNRSNQS